MRGASLTIHTGTRERRVALTDYLDAAAEEQATLAAAAWIKALRNLSVDGQPLRRRFTVREDSLWWFAELFLHKQQVVSSIFRLLAALDRMREAEHPSVLRPESGARVLGEVVRAFAARHRIRYDGPAHRSGLRLARMDARARALALAASASRLRRSGLPRGARADVAVFAHRAFWRAGVDEGGAESYIGPVLSALEQRLDGRAIRYVGVGPSANFDARRWWHPLVGRNPADALTPVESFAPRGALAESRRVWRSRHAFRRLLLSSADIRGHARIGGIDCWPLIREELAGVALLQWPWSVRAMDEAAAALEALRPRVAVTYAEAGGWGRALVLETRRRGIPSAGLQHGFIYRHWLNYLHEPDEMAPDPEHPADAGFPAPTLTLLFDAYAGEHLQRAGHFPAAALAVTGSPRLDALVSTAARLSAADVARTRRDAGASDTQALALVVTKAREARHVLPMLMSAVAGQTGIHLVIKTHPAETPDAYDYVASRRPNVRVLAADAPLAPLLRASQAVITVNSTVALDAAVLGIPALVIGLPNNLTPFVDAGVMAGATTADEITAGLHRILYDEQFRLHLERARRAFLARFAIGSDGGAAERSAEAIVALMNPADAE